MVILIGYKRLFFNVFGYVQTVHGNSMSYKRRIDAWNRVANDEFDFSVVDNLKDLRKSVRAMFFFSLKIADRYVGFVRVSFSQ